MAFNYEYPYVDPNRYNADWLLNRMKELVAEMDELSEAVAAIDITKEEVEQLVSNAIITAEAYADAAIASHYTGTVQPYIQQVVDAANAVMKAYVDSQDVTYYQSSANRMDQLHQDSINYIDNKVLNVLNMSNPITGETQPIPDVIDYIVDQFHRTNALTAGVYDGYELTANDYDSQLITAFDYDFNGANAVVH